MRCWLMACSNNPDSRVWCSFTPFWSGSIQKYTRGGETFLLYWQSDLWNVAILPEWVYSSVPANRYGPILQMGKPAYLLVTNHKQHLDASRSLRRAYAFLTCQFTDFVAKLLLPWRCADGKVQSSSSLCLVWIYRILAGVNKGQASTCTSGSLCGAFLRAF